VGDDHLLAFGRMALEPLSDDHLGSTARIDVGRVDGVATRSFAPLPPTSARASSTIARRLLPLANNSITFTPARRQASRRCIWPRADALKAKAREFAGQSPVQPLALLNAVGEMLPKDAVVIDETIS
jgi:hypothetical protein